MSKPVFRLDEQQYPDESFISTETGYWRRNEFLAELASRSTKYYLGGVVSLDAVLPLLCLGHLKQSYLLLFQSTEVCLKGVLDEMRSMSLASWMQKNPTLAQRLAGRSLEAPPSDMHNLTFLAAFRAVMPLLNLRQDIASSVDILNATRNDIAHHGGRRGENARYLGLILNNILPLLDNIFFSILGLDLADFLLHPISRELVVAGKYHRLAGGTDACVLPCINLISSAYFSIYRFGNIGIPEFDGDGYGTFRSDADEYIELQRRVRSSLVFDEVGSGSYVPGGLCRVTYCHICGEECCVSSAFQEQRSSTGELSFDVQQVKCPYCRLDIDEPLLAELHYGRISRQLIGEDEWRSLLNDLGIEDSSSEKGNVKE